MGQKLVKLAPHLVKKIWGGKNISKWKALEADLIGESWEVSTHREGSSSLGNLPLSNFIDLNYLVKFIDTSDNLSIQVHPDDEYAMEHENDKGKTECWLILDAQEGAGIYLGFRPEVTKKEFKTAVLNNVSVQKYLNFIPVKKGDFFVVPSGAVHAIGEGVSLVEIQQSSGVTYRVWDWGRLDDKGVSRELHIDDAFNVLNFSSKFQNDLVLFQKSNLLNNKHNELLLKHQDFKTELLYFQMQKEHTLRLNKGASITVLEGTFQVEELTLSSYQSYLVIEDHEIKFKPSENVYLVVTI